GSCCYGASERVNPSGGREYRSPGEDREAQRVATGHVARSVARRQRRLEATGREGAAADASRERHRTPAGRKVATERARRDQPGAARTAPPRAGGREAAPADATAGE